MVGETLSEACSIRRAVRQGCSLSPLLLIICDEAIAREVCHECAIGIRIGGKIVNMIRPVSYTHLTLPTNREV